MNKKPLILLAAGALAMLLSCSDSTKADNTQPIVTESKLHVTAQDARDGKFLDAKATLRSTGEVLNIKAADNKAAFKVPVGTHKVLVEAANYAKAEVTTSTGANNEAGIHVAVNQHLGVQLYPVSEQTRIIGSLVYNNENNKNKVEPAAGVVVELKFDASLNLLEPVVYCTTDTKGKYEFKNLPAVGTNYSLRTLPSILPNGAIYGHSFFVTNTYPLLLNSTANFLQTNMKDLAANVSVAGLIDYTKVIEADQPIEFYFRDAINPTTLNNTTFYRSLSSTDVGAYDINWDDKGTIILTPVSGKWKSGAPEFCFNGVTSVKGQVLTGSCLPVSILAPDISAEKVEGLVNIDSTTITYDATSTALMLKTVEGAEDYEVYVAKKGSNKFVKVDGVSFGDADIFDICPQPLVTCTKSVKDYQKASVTFPASVTKQCDDPADILDKGKCIGKETLVFKVLAYNSKSKTVLSAEREVGDFTAPNFDKDTHLEESKKAFTTEGNFFAESASNKFLFNFYGELPPPPAVVGTLGHLTAHEFEGKYTLGAHLAISDHSDPPVAIGYIKFGERMDVHSTPEVEVITKDESNSNKKLKEKLKLDFDWNANGDVLTITVYTEGGLDVAPGNVDAIYRIKNLKDKAGNAFASTYASSSASKGTVDIRFKAAVLEDLCEGDLIETAHCTSFCKSKPDSRKCEIWACTGGNRGGLINGLTPDTGPLESFCSAYCTVANKDQSVCKNWACNTFGVESNECKFQCAGKTGTGANPNDPKCMQPWICTDVDGLNGWGGAGKLSVKCSDYCVTNPTTGNCGDVSCSSDPGGSGPLSAKCEAFCDGNRGDTEFGCSTNWACLSPNKNSAECKTQCTSLNYKPYCSAQDWTCEEFGNSTSQCRSYCMGGTDPWLVPTAPTSTTCTGNVPDIFGTTANTDLWNYCKLVYVKQSYNTLPQGCRDVYNACQFSSFASGGTDIDGNSGIVRVDPACPTFCSLNATNAGNALCTQNVTDIFPAALSDGRLGYCKLLGTHTSYTTKASLMALNSTEKGDACIPPYKTCEIFNAYDAVLDKVIGTGACATTCANEYNNTAFSNGSWTTMLNAGEGCGDYFGSECELFGSGDTRCTSCDQPRCTTYPGSP